MITLNEATKGMLDCMDNLRTLKAKDQPTYLSEQIYRLGQYTAAVEYHLGETEQWYEESEAELLREAIHDKGLSASMAEKEVKMNLGNVEGQIKYLTRVTKAAWALHMGGISRVKHLNDEMKGTT